VTEATARPVGAAAEAEPAATAAAASAEQTTTFRMTPTLMAFANPGPTAGRIAPVR